jgi:NADH-quinone oxidoreductase subunit L
MWVGAATAFLTACLALVENDLKRILAYSTLSQLGYMVMALGLGGPAAGMYHLTTHAFFKALLFLAAGSVIHATHQQELGALGGLRRAMPWTAAVFFIGSLAMSGGFPLSGFWSKDAVLLAARHQHPAVMWWLLVGAVMTSAYVFRLYLRCFEGPAPQGAGDHAHESPPIMVIPLLALALGAALAGLVGSPWMDHQIFHLLGAGDAHHGLDLPILALSTLALAVGLGLAWLVGLQRRNLLPVPLRPLGRRLYSWAAHKYYVDEVYGRAIIQPFLRLTERLSTFDRDVVDGAVNGAGHAGWRLSQWKGWVDQHVVDRAVNDLAQAVRASGAGLRWVQTGVIQQYLLVVVVSVVMLSMALRR